MMIQETLRQRYGSFKLFKTRGVTIYQYIGILRYSVRGTVYRYAHTRIPVYRNTVGVLYTQQKKLRKMCSSAYCNKSSKELKN